MNTTLDYSTASAAKRRGAAFWIGWVLSVLPVPLLLFSATMKLMRTEQVVKGFAEFGYPANVIIPLGVIELVSTILYVIPQTSVLGAIILTGYLGGATATHVRAGQPWFMPVLMGVVLWLGLYVRNARLRDLVPLRK